MKRLHIAKDFSLPREALLHVWSVLAVRGAGKTYMGSVLVEEILDAKMMPVIVIDPMDAWYGLKSSADGKSEGYPIIVMGGTHADVPLEPTAGALVADFFIEHRQSLILVPAQGDHRWPKAQQVRFVADFGARLYERNAGQLVFLAVDEADIFANQRPGKDELRCLGVMEDIVKRGRKPGIFPLLITQRSSNLNKNVLDETEMLVALRTMSPRDQDALESWFQHLPKAQRERKEKLLETWAKLPNGTAWFWCPPMDLFQQVKIRERHTFNSSATPKFGEKPIEPKVLAPVDLEILKQRMAATIERVKQSDPRELQREVARLRAELHTAETFQRLQTPKLPPVKEKRVEVPVIKDAQIKRIVAALKRADAMVEALRAAVEPLGAVVKVQRSITMPGIARPVFQAAALAVDAPSPMKRIEVTKTRAPAPSGNGAALEGLKAGARRMVAVMAARGGPVSRAQLGTLAKISKGGGTFSTYLGQLRERGLVEEQNGQIVLTGAGAAVAHQVEDVGAVHEVWSKRLKRGARQMLQVLAEWHPLVLTRTQVGMLARVSAKGGTFSTYLGLLKDNGLVMEAAGGLAVTIDGIAVSGVTPKPPANMVDVAARFAPVFKRGVRNLLDHLIRRPDKWVDKSEWAEAAGVTRSGGTFSTYVGILWANGLIEKSDAQVRLSEEILTGVR